ncbi:MAG: MBL fold metallo-hydrolase [Candidatus Hodarchaeales archaeon]|jgi:L-ascorbate metabolism protein UlaG (beta-lactamase superfamily)
MSKKIDPIISLMESNVTGKEIAFIYFGWAGILLKTRGKTLAFDLSNYIMKDHDISHIKKLDLQLNSHTHYDHFEVPSTLQLYKDTKANVIAEPQVYDELVGEIPEDALYSASPDKTLSINGFLIKSVVGIHPKPITLFHVEWNNFRVFHGGDSDYIPLSEYPSDIAFIPTGSPSPSCSPKKGLKMVLDLKPSTVIAVHGNKSQTKKFSQMVKESLPETKVVIPQKNVITQLSS